MCNHHPVDLQSSAKNSNRERYDGIPYRHTPNWTLLFFFNEAHGHVRGYVKELRKEEAPLCKREYWRKTFLSASCVATRVTKSRASIHSPMRRKIVVFRSSCSDLKAPLVNRVNIRGNANIRAPRTSGRCDSLFLSRRDRYSGITN